MATFHKYECEIRLKMSDEKDQLKEPSKEGEKKTKTLVGATHLLKAKALSQLELKEFAEQEKADRVANVEDRNGIENRPTSGQSSTIHADAKSTPPNSTGVAGQAGGANLTPNVEVDSAGDAGEGLGKNQVDINNSKQGIGDLGDDSTAAKPESTGEHSGDVASKDEIIVNKDEGKEIIDSQPELGESGGKRIEDLAEISVPNISPASNQGASNNKQKEELSPDSNAVSKDKDSQRLEDQQAEKQASENQNSSKEKEVGDSRELENELEKDTKVSEAELESGKQSPKENKDLEANIGEAVVGGESKEVFSSVNDSVSKEVTSSAKEGIMEKDEEKESPSNVIDSGNDEASINVKDQDQTLTSEKLKNDEMTNGPVSEGTENTAAASKSENASKSLLGQENKVEGFEDVTEGGKGSNKGQGNVSSVENNEEQTGIPNAEVTEKDGTINVEEVSASTEGESAKNDTAEQDVDTKENVSGKVEKDKPADGIHESDFSTGNGGFESEDAVKSRVNNRDERPADPRNRSDSSKGNDRTDDVDDVRHDISNGNDDAVDVNEANAKQGDAQTSSTEKNVEDSIKNSSYEEDGDKGKKVNEDDAIPEKREDAAESVSKAETVDQKSATLTVNQETIETDSKEDKGENQDIMKTNDPTKDKEETQVARVEDAATSDTKNQDDVVKESDSKDETREEENKVEDGKLSATEEGHALEIPTNETSESSKVSEKDNFETQSNESKVEPKRKSANGITENPIVKGEGIVLEKSPRQVKQETTESNEGDNEDDGYADTKEVQDEEGKEEDDGDEMANMDSNEHEIPGDFYYNFDEIVSKPYTTEGIPKDMVNLYHSFGFECTKRSNMHMVDNDHMIFSAGNMLQILNIKTSQKSYIRSRKGGGIGAIAVHPSRKYFAVAEKGEKPDILIYEYPSLKVYRILRDGTEKAYANLDFTPTGDRLASVGSAPDYMLTVWDWINENIVLRSKAFSQDVFKVAFSPENEGHLCTSGTGHIRFWTMATTFTGLKLQGELGRFGTTELTDIAGFVELPDGKVLSGSEWGNMLLWDGGLIKVEIARKGKKACHQGMIEQFFLDEGELITIGVDGFVKVWDFETIDTAEAADESKIFEMEPMSELKVGPDVKLVSMVKSVNPNDASIWYAQDGSGGIWKLDLSFVHTSQAPKRLFSFHAGAITGLAPSPMTHLSATIGEDHTVRLFDYLAKTPLCQSRFTAPGSCILWMPKVVDADGLSILTGFADGVVRQLTVVKGDQNMVTSKKNGSGFELKLTQVFKPHVKSVTSLAVSKDGKFLATGSEDSTVFFFSIEKRYKPIGFIETGAAVVSLDWSTSQKESTLLICCKDGCVLEVSCPKPDDYDTSKTYLIPLPGLKRTEFKFKSIKDKLVKAEEDLRKAKEEEERRKQQEEEKRKKKERGIEEDEEEDDENKENEEESVEREETPIEEIIHEPGEIVNGFYKGESGNFWLLLDGWDAGYAYECTFPNQEDDDVFAEPLKAIKFDDIDDVSVRSHCFSKRGHYLALGLDNGAVRVQVIESEEIENFNSYWSLNMHDNHLGAVTNITMSFDEKFLLSAGHDGNFFIYSFMDEEKLKQIIGKQKAEIAKKLDSSKIARIDDIEDPNHYSIELEKQKAEHDRMVRLAEEKKQQARQTISLLRREFKRLVSRNQEMPTYLQLPPLEFIIDPNMKDDIEDETKKKLSLVEREMAWESEKYSLSLRKLEMRFKDMIECERFKLHAFRTQHTVTSYRATFLPPEFSEAMEQNRNRIRTSEAETGAMPLTKRLSVLAKKFKDASKEDVSLEGKEAIHAKKSKPIQNLDGKIAKAIEKAEQKKKRRMERKAKWDELYRSRPDLDYEDPVILAAIKEAQENMGDFKLKSAKDYIVPEKERVNADKKRAQLMQLKEQIYQRKRHFNEKLLHLRDRKIEVIAEVKSLTEELENVQNELPLSMHIALPPVPTMQPDEQPEKMFEYTSESLNTFKKNMDEQDQNSKSEHAEGFGGGFGGFGAGEQAQQLTTKLTSQLTSARGGTEQRGRSTSILSTLSSQPRSGSSIAIDHGSPETISEETLIDDKPSDMEMRVRDEQKIRTIYRRDMLLRKIKELLVTFDAELRTLRHDKLHLDVDLKNADLRMITLFEELVLLKEFEKRENVLMGKVELKMQEKADMEDKVEDCQMKLQSKKEEIEKLQEKEKSLSAVFSNLFIESNKFEAFLTRVYKKKIKRVKKTEQDAGSDEESEDDLSDDDYDSDEDENSDAEELDDSVCPPGCDQALFDQVCQLREKRLDLEEATVEEKKGADTLKKELDALKKKAKVIESALMTAEADLEAFQREKQQKLNELDIIVTLKLSQLQYLKNNALPQDLSQCLIFTSTSLDELQRRINELEKEKAEQKKLYWKLRQQHVTLIRDKKSIEERITQLEEKVQQMQLLKFGKLVDLEKLETVSVNKAAEELKEQLRSQEFANAKEISQWEKRIDDAKAKLTQVTRENTQRLDTYTVLLQEKKELEHQLDSRQKNLGDEFQGNRKADFQERQRLIQLVQLQSQEIDALKEEIGLLSRKGGHILPPSQAPIPTAPTSTH